jgi:DNA-binding MarR family transcriptional regulator
MTKDPTGVPDELFHAVATLIARLDFIAEQECNIEPIELFVLWHIKNFGRSNDKGRPIILRHDLSNVLKRKFRYSDSDTTKLLNALQDQGYIDRGSLTTHERASIFGDAVGTRLVVLLLPTGIEKIDSFRNLLKNRFSAWLSEKSKITQLATRKFLPIATEFAQWLIDRYEPVTLMEPEATEELEES